MRAAGMAMVVIACALAGCTTPAPPRGLTDAEAQAIVAEQNRQWWEAIAPGEPMPHHEVIAYMVQGGPDLQWHCVDDLHIDGIRFTEDRQLIVLDPAAEDVFRRAVFECNQMYPYLIDDPEAFGLYSQEQLDYFASYFEHRLTPCLRSLGYAIGDPPSDSFTEPYLGWMPYYSLLPTSTQPWEYLALRCPPPAGVDFPFS